MIDHISRIPLTSSGEASLFVFGDRQQGSSGFRAEAWQEFRNEFKRTKNAWALGLGDYGDWLRPSLRPVVESALKKDDSARKMLDNDVRLGHDKIIDDMDFLSGRLIGIHEGHHNWNFASGGNTDQRLASALKAPYLGWIASTRLVLMKHGIKEANGHSFVWTIISTHGNANGRRVPAALSWIETNLANAFIADQYIGGHGCKNASEAPYKRAMVRRVGPPGLIHHIPRILSVGGFAEGYTNGWESDYVERAGFSPQPMGWGLITFKIVRRKAEALARGVAARGTDILDVDNRNRLFLEV